MNDDIFYEAVIRAARNLHLYCKSRQDCKDCPLWRVSNDKYDYGFCAVSGDSPENWYFDWNRRGADRMKNNHIYAAYRGEDNLADGTLDELAEKLHITRKTLSWYTMPSAKRKERESIKKGWNINRRLSLVLIE